MANEQKTVHIVRPLSVYIDGNKQGEVKSGSYKLDANREVQITDGGYSGHSSGGKVATVDIKQLVGVTTSSFGRIHDSVLSDGYLSIAIPVEGRVVMFVGVIKNISLDWDHTKGSAEGSATFEGGQVQNQ